MHIRRYKTDDRGFLYPTKDGVSLSPRIWKAFNQQSFVGKENVLVVEKDLMISKHYVEGGQLISLQRMFKRKNLCFQIVPEHVVMNVDQLRQLDLNTNVINYIIKENLLCYSMDYFVQQHLKKVPDLQCSGDPDKPNGFTELKDSLIKSIKTAFKQNIDDLFKCLGCQQNQEISFYDHECSRVTPTEKFEFYFDDVLYDIDWSQLAKTFVQENINNVNFQKLIFDCDFFKVINVNEIFDDVKKFYVKEETAYYDSLFSNLDK